MFSNDDQVFLYNLSFADISLEPIKYKLNWLNMANVVDTPNSQDPDTTAISMLHLFFQPFYVPNDDTNPSENHNDTTLPE